MKNSIYYITLFCTFIFLNSCSTDEFIQTEVGLQYSTYTGKVGDIDTIYATFKNGRNNKYKTEFILSSTNAKVIASSYNYAVIQYTSIGTGDLTLKFYAKGSMISEATATIITNNLGGGGSGSGSSNNAINKIFFQDYFLGTQYLIDPNGSNKTELTNFKDIKKGVLSQDGKNIYYQDYNGYLGVYNVSGKNCTDQYAKSTVNSLNVSADNYIVIGTSSSGGEVCSNLNTTKTSFFPSYYNSNSSFYNTNTESFYIHKYNGSFSNAEYLSTCYSNSYYSLDYIKAGSRKNIEQGYYLNFLKFKISSNGKYIGYIIYDSYYSTYSIKIYDIINQTSIGQIYTSSNQILDFQFNKDGSNIVFAAKTSSSSYNDLFVKSSTSTANSATNITNTSSIDERLPDWK